MRKIKSQVFTVGQDQLDYFVRAGEAFDLSDYCDTYRLEPTEVDPKSVKAVQAAALALSPGEYLAVTHD